MISQGNKPKIKCSSCLREKVDVSPFVQPFLLDPVFAVGVHKLVCGANRAIAHFSDLRNLARGFWIGHEV